MSRIDKDQIMRDLYDDHGLLPAAYIALYRSNPAATNAMDFARGTSTPPSKGGATVEIRIRGSVNSPEELYFTDQGTARAYVALLMVSRAAYTGRSISPERAAAICNFYFGKSDFIGDRGNKSHRACEVRIFKSFADAFVPI
jgi:hypothetical protein